MVSDKELARQGAAIGIGAFLGTALAESLETPGTTGTGGGTTTVDLSGVIAELQMMETTLGQILTALNSLSTSGSDLTTLQAIQQDLDLIVAPNAINANIDVISTTTGAVIQQLYPNAKKIRKAIIQNISTDPVTIFSTIGTSNGARGTNSQGIILNAASGAGSGGGTLPTNNIDLSYFWFYAATTGDKLAVYSEL